MQFTGLEQVKLYIQTKAPIVISLKHRAHLLLKQFQNLPHLPGHLLQSQLQRKVNLLLKSNKSKSNKSRLKKVDVKVNNNQEYLKILNSVEAILIPIALRFLYKTGILIFNLVQALLMTIKMSN